MSKAAELANLIGNINAGSPLAERNLVHNGAMLVSQRGSSAITLSGLTPNIDRFTAFKSNDGTQTVEQSTDGPEGFKNSLKVTNTSADSSVAAGDRVAIIYRCEGQHISHLEWGTANAKTCTLSFYVKSSITGSHGGAFVNGSDNRAYPFTYTISSANTWERKIITVEGDTSGTWAIDNTRSLQICWGLGVGSSNSGTADAWESADRNSATGATTDFLTTANATWFLTGVQLEIGQNATAFEHEPFERTLAKCQRYYFLLVEGDNEPVCQGGMFDGDSFIGQVPFPVTMRAAPTLDEVEGTSFFRLVRNNGTDDCDSVAINRDGTDVCHIEMEGNVSGTAGHQVMVRSNNSSAKIAFKAEL